MPLTTTFESSKHWDLGRVMRRRPSSGNSSEGDNHFSFKRLVEKARRGRTSPTYGGDRDAPPPPPPKDGPRRSFSPSFYSASRPSHQAKGSTSTEGSHGSRSNMENGYSKSPHHVNFTFSEVHISSNIPMNPMNASRLGINSQKSASPLVSPPFEPFRRPAGPPMKLPTPAERAKARIEAEREKEFETCLAIQEEEERQARIKAEKEEQRRQEEEEEVRRKAKIEQDIRIAQLLKKQREHAQAKVDEQFVQEVEERRKANKEKRLQEHYRSQAWRIEQEVLKEETIHKKEEDKKRGEEVKMQERKRLFNTLKASAEHSGRLELSGWISVQTAGTVTWRRRWFTFDEKTLKFFKAQNDASPVDLIVVSDIRDVRNCGGPSEEEPTFIPNSFVIEEVHGCCWSLFTDTQDAMVCLQSVLVDPNLKAFTGKCDGRVDIHLGRP
ncbi:hypothetical protein BJ322DRAFT_1061390 [Thelephora terrestris]|uniref:PH domain-containing protein n=1 Tax=Thelephora terrestris TaxID=56493 RepID=A0A9P6L6R5_9AGAM|nr:hypothetical protein BJ322DRAFT_1061390 [Thelephora terrestris]